MSPFFRSAFVLYVCLLVLVVPMPSRANPPTYSPRFEAGTCPAHFAGHPDVRCGTVVVPQDRALPDGLDVRLAVAVFRATGDVTAPDPLIFLDGGPGLRTLDSYASGFGDFMRQINERRDVILFDYRGIGYSEPALTCPELLERSNTEWVAMCRDRFAAQGVDVTHYTTRENAADAADVVHALGYERYNIWGGSYGSSVALTLLRDHSEDIRAALITALQPPQADLYAALPVEFEQTLLEISAVCQADPTCSVAFPDNLAESVAIIVERLNTQPLPVRVADGQVVVRGDDIVVGLSQIMKDEKNIPLIPSFIAALRAEEYSVIEPYASELMSSPDPQSAIGAYLSMRCTDSILAVAPEAHQAALEQIHPQLRPAFQHRLESQVELCHAWGARVPTAEDRLPAASDVPTLIVSGALDPYSSQQWLDSTLATLPNGQGLMLPYHQHYVVQNPCAAGLLTGFLDDPAAQLDMSCTTGVRPPFFRLR